MGRPVVAEDGGGAAEAVLPGVTGWLAPAGDPAALAEALQSALSLSTERRAEVARAAQEQVRGRYGLAQANRQLLQLYERLAALRTAESACRRSATTRRSAAALTTQPAVSRIYLQAHGTPGFSPLQLSRPPFELDSAGRAPLCRFPAVFRRRHASCRARAVFESSYAVVAMINISLPDGSVRSFDKPVSGAEIAASIGPGLAKAALAAARRRQDEGPLPRRRSRRQDRHRDVARSRRRSSCCATTRRTCWPRRSRNSIPARRSRSARRRRTASTTTSCASSRSRPRTSPRSSSAWPRSSTATCRSRARSGTAPRIKDYFVRARRELQGRVGRRAAQGRGDLGLQAGRLARHVPRPAPALDGQARQGVQADEGVGRLLARRRQQRPAAARLRHGLLLRQGAEGLPAPHRGGREARPSQARPRDGPLPSAGRGRRHGVLAPQGLDALAHARELSAAQARGRRLSSR